MNCSSSDIEIVAVTTVVTYDTECVNISLSLGKLFLGEMQRIAFRLMPSSCVCVYVCVCVCVSVCVCVPHLWTSGKRFEIEMPFFFEIARNDTGHNL